MMATAATTTATTTAASATISTTVTSGLPVGEDAVVEMDPHEEAVASREIEESGRNMKEKTISCKLLQAAEEAELMEEMVVEIAAVAGGGDPTSGCAWKSNAKKIKTNITTITTNTTTQPTEEVTMIDPTDSTRLSSFIVGGFVVAMVVEEEWVEGEEGGAVDALVVGRDPVVKILIWLPVVLPMEQMPAQKQASSSK
jgi:hypothetical protein